MKTDTSGKLNDVKYDSDNEPLSKLANSSTEEDSNYDAAEYLIDTERVRKECSNLDGSFESARKHMLNWGPWILPRSLGEDKFEDVAKIVLDNICK